MPWSMPLILTVSRTIGWGNLRSKDSNSGWPEVRNQGAKCTRRILAFFHPFGRWRPQEM
jgi:hypothetical protein